MANSSRKTTIKVGNRFLTPLGIGRNGLGLVDCLAELIANSFDWNTAKIDGSVVKIHITFGNDFIEVRDNGAGMTEDELDIAINLAEAEDKLRAKLDDAERKGMYGMGLKIAALSLGWEFTINTISYKDQEHEHQFHFNSRLLLDNNSKYLDTGLVITTEDDRDKFVLRDFRHGTRVLIQGLEKKDIQFMNSLVDEMKVRFLPDINSLSVDGGLDFKIIEKTNGISDRIFKVDQADIRRLFEDDILELDFENPHSRAKKEKYKYIGKSGREYQLKGFLQLLAKSSQAKREYGLNLYYRGQLIERYHKGTLLTSLGRAAEKTYGELHLDGCEPDPTKKKFIEDESFHNVKELIASDLEFYKYLNPSTNLAKKRVQQEIDIRKGIKIDHRRPRLTSNISTLDDAELTDDPTSELDGYPEGTIKIKDRLFIQITKDCVIEGTLATTAKVNWESSYIKHKEHNDIRILRVYINPNSQLINSVQELYENEKQKNTILDFYKRIAICESIFEKLIEVHNLETEEARELTDTCAYPQVLKLKNLK
ncbi:MAG: ATP-binding protein [Cyclobacteriaceae bacterium]|nr:ATP-binding protein [Cyclobacteriaceae bacterium]